VFDNEHSLHLWKRHPCTSTVERQLTEWREQFIIWRDLRGLLYSHSDIVCKNPIQLYWISTINKCLNMGSWLLDHPVYWVRVLKSWLCFRDQSAHLPDVRSICNSRPMGREALCVNKTHLLRHEDVRTVKMAISIFRVATPSGLK
jgi:hypothetical protein